MARQESDTVALLHISIGLFLLSLMLPFLALLIPSVTVIAEFPSANWNASAPLGVPSFDYGSYPALSGDFFRDVPVINCHSV